jgi:hypothetical protein
MLLANTGTTAGWPVTIWNIGMFKRDTLFPQIGCTGIGLSVTDVAFLRFKRDMQFHVGVGSMHGGDTRNATKMRK